jgi:hypothetical protein
MKKHIPLILAAMAFCLLPPLCILPPLLFGAGGTTTAVKKNCGFTGFNGPCNYSAGCNLKIFLCSTYNKDKAVCTSSKQTELATNLFSCVTGTAQQACDPVPNSNGNAATTDCVIFYQCVYNDNTGACTQGAKSGTPCQSPYYMDDTCP